jgi:N-acetylglucosamine-6-phosphate deacetylase
MPQRTIIADVEAVLGPPGTERGRYDIAVAGGRIESLTPTAAVFPDGAARINGAGLVACPGFIDLHIHGGRGADFMDATDDAFATIAAYHAAGGTTAYWPTTASEEAAAIFACIDEAARCRDQRIGGVEILGVHVEGPYMARAKSGCHDPARVRAPSPAENRGYLDRAHIVRRVTLAPELPDALEFIRELSRLGIVPSGGHSEATLDQVMRAADAGMTMITHLYSAMSSISKAGPFRVPGMLEATLLDDRLATELIADLRHLPKELLLLVLKAKAQAAVCFVTDAMRGAGMPDGRYMFGSRNGTPAIVERGAARNLENTGFASSTVRMIDLVRNGVTALGLDLAAAVSRATVHPARIAGVLARKGTLEPGKDADIVLLQTAPELSVRLTMTRGDVIYQAGK